MESRTFTSKGLEPFVEGPHDGWNREVRMATPDKDTQDSTTLIAPLSPSIHKDFSTGDLQKFPGLTPPPLTEHHVEMPSAGEPCGWALSRARGRAAAHRSVARYSIQSEEDSWSYLLGVTSPSPHPPQYSSSSWLAFPGYLPTYLAPSAPALTHPCPGAVIPSCFLSLYASFSSKGH